MVELIIWCMFHQQSVPAGVPGFVPWSGAARGVAGRVPGAGRGAQQEEPLPRGHRTHHHATRQQQTR